MSTMRHGPALLLLLFAGSCSSAPTPAVSPGPSGTYDGSCDAGQGRLDLRPDQSFSFRLHFAYFDFGWDLHGHWHMVQPGERARSRATSFVEVELVVEQSKLDIAAAVAKEWDLEGADPEFPVGTTLLVRTNAREAIFDAGPCVAFFLPRVR